MRTKLRSSVTSVLAKIVVGIGPTSAHEGGVFRVEFAIIYQPKSSLHYVNLIGRRIIFCYLIIQSNIECSIDLCNLDDITDVMPSYDQ